MKLSPSRVLSELIAQHDTLRGMMDHCEDLANSLDDHPDSDPTPLTRELARLRLAFDAHNRFEEHLLRPVLLEHDAFGNVRVERMVDDHVHEHRAIRDRLASPATSALRDVIETLRAHLDAEERYLLTSRVLRDDLVSIESAG
ncbi:MAG: hemerythrin domain-containing protein [Deltaproteobacteria bacterium]|nr:hemerythrin domain-containing protein [Deltaproteobacteria bacterium]